MSTFRLLLTLTFVFLLELTLTFLLEFLLTLALWFELAPLLTLLLVAPPPSRAKAAAGSARPEAAIAMLSSPARGSLRMGLRFMAVSSVTLRRRPGGIQSSVRPWAARR